jgi:hypothetical protein
MKKEVSLPHPVDQQPSSRVNWVRLGSRRTSKSLSTQKTEAAFSSEASDYELLYPRRQCYSFLGYIIVIQVVTVSLIQMMACV